MSTLRLVPNTMFSKFRHEVKNCLNSPKEENGYKYYVAQKLREYRKDHLLTRIRGKNVDPWPGWINDARDGFDVEKKKALALKISNVNSLAQRDSGQQGDLVYALAGHYRLHMHLYEDNLSYAHDIDDYVFKDGPYPFDKDIFVVKEKEVSDGGIANPSSLAEIEDAGWNQVPASSDEYELSVRVRYNVMNRVFEGRDLQFGLMQAMMRVRPENFKVIREYCSYADQLTGSYVRDGDLRWVSTEPRDNYQMLRGTSVAGPICVATPISDNAASLSLDTFARSSEFDLSITDLASRNRISADDPEKANLIERIFAIYIKKINEIDDEHVLLGSSKVTR